MGSELMNVYYEDCTLLFDDLEWLKTKKRILPYIVHERDPEEREKFRAFLESEGFIRETGSAIYPDVLVNMEFRIFGLIYLVHMYLIKKITQTNLFEVYVDRNLKYSTIQKEEPPTYKILYNILRNIDNK